MDASKLTQMRMEAANTYKSFWQPRDASEVTLRKQSLAQQGNSSEHKSPNTGCCLPKPQSADPPTNGFSTDYSLSIVTEKSAGCANCNDVAWGASGGIALKSCSEVETILEKPLNPVQRAEAFWGTPNQIPVYCVPCADPGVKAGAKDVQFTHNCVKASPAYSGWRNQVAVSATGVRPLQVPDLPS